MVTWILVSRCGYGLLSPVRSLFKTPDSWSLKTSRPVKVELFFFGPGLHVCLNCCSWSRAAKWISVSKQAAEQSQWTIYDTRLCREVYRMILCWSVISFRIQVHVHSWTEWSSVCSFISDTSSCTQVILCLSIVLFRVYMFMHTGEQNDHLFVVSFQVRVNRMILCL